MSEITPQRIVIKDDGDESGGALYEFKLTNGRLKLSRLDGSASDEDISVAVNWPSVTALADGDDVNAATFNKPLSELADRTEYLKNELKVFNRDDPLSAVVLTDAKLSGTGTPDVGDVVYLDADTRSYSKALATVDLLDQFSASNSANAVGILLSRRGLNGDVGVFGKVSLKTAGAHVSDMVESGEVFRDGKYYLSGREAGKITAFPSGPRVELGQFFSISETASGDDVRGDFALLNVQARSLAESHVHRSFGLKGLPCGEAAVEGAGDDAVHVFLGYSPDGWDPSSGEIVPRLVFTGSWLSSSDCKYEFRLEGVEDGATLDGDLVFGENPGVYRAWSNKTAGTTGKIKIESFKTPYDVENGMMVELRQNSGVSNSELVYHKPVDYDSAEHRVWSAGMTFPGAGMGWRDLSDTEKARFLPKNGPKFVYNAGFDRNFQVFYPPSPLNSVSLLVNGAEITGKHARFDKNADFTYSAESDSIYWWKSSYGDAPWPSDYENMAAVRENPSEKTIFANLVQSTGADTGPVTSLRAREGSGLRVFRCGTDSVSDVGDLEIDFDPTGDVVDAEMEGYKVVKGGSDGKFKTGPVVERIIAGPGISVSRYGDCPSGQGTVVIGTKSGGIEGDFEEVVLQNAKQDLVGMFPYVRLLEWTTGGTNTNSAFIMKFHVPYDDPDAVYRVHFSSSVFGTSGYTGTSVREAGIRLQYNILPDLNTVDASGSVTASANVQEDLIAADAERVATISVVSSADGTGYTYKAFDPLYVHTIDESSSVLGKSEAAFGAPVPKFDECPTFVQRHDSVESSFGVRPGYTVAIRISRGQVAGPGTSEYTGSLGFMNMRWRLERIV